MREHKATIGSVRITDNGKIYFEAGKSNEGECYKDLDAWEKGQFGTDFNIIYIGEYGLIDWANKGNTDNFDLEEISWTRESWIDWVRDELSWSNYEEISKDEKFVEYLAKAILDLCDWQDLSTKLDEWLSDTDVEETYIEWRRSLA